jgi:hypothetical protein
VKRTAIKRDRALSNNYEVVRVYQLEVCRCIVGERAPWPSCRILDRRVEHPSLADACHCGRLPGGNINSATPLKRLGNRLETNATTIGSEINAKMAIFIFSRGLTVLILTDFKVRLYD